MLDSGSRSSFSSGAVREPQDGKPRYDLIPLEALKGWGAWMALGAEKYSDRNWERECHCPDLKLVHGDT